MRFGKTAVGQQASFRRWQEDGKRYLGMTIFQISPAASSDRRDMAAAQFYEFPADWVSQHNVRLAALYEAAISAELPGHGDVRTLKLDVTVGDSPIVELLRDNAQASTRILRLASAVLEKPVIVTSGPADLRKRLDLLDVVLTLLPAWFRADVSTTTWTDKPRKDYRLAFGGEAERGYTSVSWEAGTADPGRYASLLEQLCADPARVEPVIRFLAALDPGETRSHRRGTSTRATDDLSVFHDLWTFDFTLPPDRARISSLLGIVRSENARHLALAKIDRIPAFAIAATGAGVTEAADLLTTLWSAEVAERAGSATANFLSDGQLAPARLLMKAADRGGDLAGFLRVTFRKIGALTASANAMTTFTELLADTAESAGTFAEVCPVLIEADDLGLRVLAVIARERPKAVAASISALATAADAGQRAPLWAKAIAPWSREGLNIRREGGRHAPAASDEESGNSAWSRLGPDAIAVAWALSHALNISDPVEYTWVLLAEPEKAAATVGVLRSQELGWALTRRFGAKMPPQTRAHADLARISIGLGLGDVPESGEAEATVSQYVGACLSGCRSPGLSPESQRRLRHLLSESLLAGEAPATARAARTLLDALAASEDADDQEWLMSHLLDDGGKRPGAAEWLRGMGQRIVRARVRSPSPTTEVEAARNLRLAVRSLKETEADTPEALDLLAQAAASEGFMHQQRPSAVGTVLREMRPWPGCRKPTSAAEFVDRWKQELARRGLPVDDAKSRADDAITQIMSGIWGSESAKRLADYYSKSISLTRDRLETQIQTYVADRIRIHADIAERRAEIQKLEAESRVMEMRMKAIRDEITAKDRSNATIMRLLSLHTHQDR